MAALSASAHFGPAEEGGNVAHGNVARQRFDTEVAVICQEHHLSLKSHCPIYERKYNY